MDRSSRLLLLDSWRRFWPRILLGGHLLCLTGCWGPYSSPTGETLLPEDSFGWARYGDKFRLCTLSITETFEQGNWITKDVGARTPLLEGSREARIAALSCAYAFIDVLVDKTQDVLGTIEGEQESIRRL